MTRDRRPLVLLEAATLVSGIGNGIAVVALPWLALERTGEAAAAGVVAAAAALPLIVSSLLSGTVVDRVGRRRTAVVADALSLVSIAAIPVLDSAVGMTLPLLMALAALGAAFDPAGITARETMIPAAAQAAGWSLERANGIHEAVWNVAFLIGPGVGGLLVATIGTAETFWVTAAAFAVALGLTSRIRVAGAGRPADHVHQDGFWESTVEGLRHVRHDPVLRDTSLIVMVVVALYLPMEGVLLPAWFTAQDQPQRLGLVLMALSLGGVIGALAYSHWGHRFSRRRAFTWSLVATSLPFLGLSFLPPFPMMVLFGAVAGVCFGPVSPLQNHALQTRTPEHLRGRVFGVAVSAAYLAGPVGYLVVGPLVDAVGLRPTFVAAGLGLVLVGLAGLALRSLDGLDDDPLHPIVDEAPWTPSHASVPLGEQAVPPARVAGAVTVGVGAPED